MDNIFRIKKTRDTVSKTKASETMSGTLDSIHQNLIMEMRDINITDLTNRQIEIQKELDDMIDQMYLDRRGNKDAISKNILSKVTNNLILGSLKS
jgi:hypothetical protein